MNSKTKTVVMALVLLTGRVLGVDMVLEEVGHSTSSGWGGFALASNQWAYASGTILDITDPGNPRSVGSLPGSPLAVSGDYLFMWPWMDANLLQILDVSNPTNPLPLGSYQLDPQNDGGSLAVSGTHAYWANPAFGLEVLDFSDPANLRRIARYELPGGPVDIALSGNFAYLLTAGTWLQETNLVNSGVTVFDISDPGNPQRVGVYQASDECIRLAVAGGYGYVGTWDGLRVIDLRDPTHPQQVGLYDLDGLGAYGVEVSGNTAAASYWGQIVLLDVTDPKNPRLVGGSARLGEAAKVGGIVNDYVFASAWHSGLHVLQRRPANPQSVGRVNASGNAGEEKGNPFTVAGNYAYLTDPDAGLLVVDLHDPAAPRLVGGYSPGVNFMGVAVSSNYAYVAAWNQGLQVFNVSDPAKPAWISGLGQIGFASAVAVSGRFAYVAVDGGLLVADISNPAQPRRAGLVPTGGSPSSVTISGHYAYVAAWDAGLQIIDIDDPGAPRLAGGYNSGGYLSAVAVSGTRAYLVGVPRDNGAGGIGGGLEILDVADPAHPQRLGGYGTTASEYGSVAVARDYAYLPSDEGVEVIDISNPADPRRVGGNFVTDHDPSFGSVLVTGDNVLYAGNGELVILDRFRPFRFEPVTGMDRSSFRFRVDGPRGVSVRLQRSSDLIHWADWLGVTFGPAPLELADPESAAEPRRFYRALTP